MQNFVRRHHVGRTEAGNLRSLAAEAEPHAAMNEGIRWAIILTAVLSVLTFFAELLAVSLAPYADRKSTEPQIIYFKQLPAGTSYVQEQAGVDNFDGVRAKPATSHPVGNKR